MWLKPAYEFKIWYITYSKRDRWIKGDSVQPYNEFEQTGTGFSFSNYNAHEMMDTIDYALHTFYDYPDAWDAIVQRAMAEKLDWDASAEQYIRLFASLL